MLLGSLSTLYWRLVPGPAALCSLPSKKRTSGKAQHHRKGRTQAGLRAEYGREGSQAEQGTGSGAGESAFLLQRTLHEVNARAPSRYKELAEISVFSLYQSLRSDPRIL